MTDAKYPLAASTLEEGRIPRRVLLVAGPPVSARLWKGVADRLRQHGLEPTAIELFDPPPPIPTVQALSARLAARFDPASETIVVAHGTAVPVAWRAAVRARPAGLVLSNGPVHRLDPLTAALARAPRPVVRFLLRPGVLERWLASSAGARRLVVNPYVMDRDTVVALVRPLVRTALHRRAVAAFLADLARVVGQPPPYGGPTLLVWGDADPLYPPYLPDEARRWLSCMRHLSIAGGQHFFPEERPWALADLIVEQLRAGRLTRTATPMSRFCPEGG